MTQNNEPGQPVPTALTKMASVDLEVPLVALAIGAHPDDIEFGCGVTLAKWAKAGCSINHLVLTDGSKGTWNVNADIPKLIAQREVEQREAARRLGSQGEVIFLQQVDGDLADTRELRSEIARHIRRLKPQVVLGHDPWKRYRLHPDHSHAGFLTCDAVVASRDPHFFKEHAIAHHRPQHLLLWEADEPDHGEDIGGFVEQKITALLVHESQFESTMKAIDQTALDNFSERMRQRMIVLGQRIDRPAAEIFKKISDI